MTCESEISKPPMVLTDNCGESYCQSRGMSFGASPYLDQYSAELLAKLPQDGICTEMNLRCQSPEFCSGLLWLAMPTAMLAPEQDAGPEH